MRDKGMTEESIAAAFFVSVTVVKQRLRLTSVSPTLLEIYADDGMTLEQLMAFTVSPDHARQEQVFAVTARHRPVWQARRDRNADLLGHPDLDPVSRQLAETRIAECDRILGELDHGKDARHDA